MKRIMVTGGAGFLGSHFCEHILKNTDWEIVIIDKLTYASTGFDRLRDVDVYDNERVNLFTHDFCLPFTDELIKEIGQINYIAHLGAETHVDRSIEDPLPFIQSNVIGTYQILEYARKISRTLEKMIYFSTDEVFGPADQYAVPNGFQEWDRYKSSNPYAAAKAGGEELCIAYQNTYKVPVMISHCMNLFGERQAAEKFIPLCINKILNGETIKIHADASCKKAGSRFWIHARNVAGAVLFLLADGEIGDKYNIVGEKEIDNLKMAQFIHMVIAEYCHKNKEVYGDEPVELNYELVDFHGSRPGHDLRYGLDGSKMYMLGYKYPKTFEDSLRKTIEWTIENNRWLG